MKQSSQYTQKKNVYFVHHFANRKWVRSCNICEQTFSASTPYERFCEPCKESSEVYRDDSPEHVFTGFHFEGDRLISDLGDVPREIA